MVGWLGLRKIQTFKLRCPLAQMYSISSRAGANLIITMSPDRHSRTSRTKKSIFGAPIPMLTIETGTSLYLPVMVKNPRSDARTKGAGLASNSDCKILALVCEPTVIYRRSDSPTFNMKRILLTRWAHNPVRNLSGTNAKVIDPQIRRAREICEPVT